MGKALETLLEEYARLPEYLGYEQVELESKSIFGDYPINIAATRGKFKEVMTLLEAGSNVNQKGEQGYTPLHNSVEQNHPMIVKFLLRKGADRKIASDDGVTPFQLATILEAELIKKLLK